MRGARIVGTGRELPPRVVKNEELTKLMDTTDEWIVQRTGIRERRYADPGVGTSHLGAAAARKAIDKAGITVNDIGLIVFATLSPDYFFPGCAVLVQEQLGMPKIGALDVRDQCTGFVYGLSVAESFVKGGFHDYVLVIGAEIHSRGMIFTTAGRDTAVIFGDGAGAIVLVADEQPGAPTDRGVLATHLRSDGRYKDKLYVDGGPSSTGTAGFLRMEGRDVFRHAVAGTTDAVEAVFRETGYTAADVDWFVPHQANKRIIDGSAHRLGIAPEKIISTVDRHGNTSAASIPLALDVAIADGRIKRGDLVLLQAVGGGFTWGAALVRW